MDRLRQLSLKISTSVMPLMGLFVGNYWSQRSLSKSKFVPNIQFKQKFGVKSAHLMTDCKQWLQGLDERPVTSAWNSNSLISVVMVRAMKANKRGTKGTGVVVRGDGLIVTNCHVVWDQQTVDVFFSRQFRKSQLYENESSNENVISVLAQVIYREPWLDLALIRVPNMKRFGLKCCQWTYDTSIGQPVDSVGNPKILWSISSGYIGSAHIYRLGGMADYALVDTDYYFISHSCPLFTGFSGGPLLNYSGQVIGINFASRDGIDNYAIHVSDVIDFIKRGVEFEAKDKRDELVLTKKLGITLRSIDNGFQMIKNIMHANSDQIHETDIITHVNDVDLLCFSQLLDAIKLLPENNYKIKFTLNRNGHDQTEILQEFADCILI